MEKKELFDKIFLNHSAFIKKNNSIIASIIEGKEYNENLLGKEYYISLIFFNDGKIEKRKFNINLINDQIFLELNDAREFLKKKLEQKIDDMCNVAAEQAIMLLSNLSSEVEQNESRQRM